MKKFILYLSLFALPFYAFAQPSNVSGVVATAGDKQVTVSWTNSGDPFGRVIVVVKEGSAVDATPSGDGSAYTANTVFGSGHEIATGNFITYNTTNGSPSNVTITGLSNGTTYHVKIFVKDNAGTNLWNSGVNASATPRPNVPTGGSFSSTTCVDEGTITFGAPAVGSGYTYLVFAKPASAITLGTPSQDPASYAAPTTNMANTSPAYEHDPAAILVYRGAAVPASINLTGLASNNSWNTFHIAVFNAEGTSYSQALTFSGSRAANTTIGNITTFNASASDLTAGLSFNFPATCADEILIVGREGAAVTVTPSGNGSAYSANASFGGGTDLDATATDQFVVYKGTGTSVNVTGLTNGTTYHFQCFVRKGSVWENSLTTSVTPKPNAPTNGTFTSTTCVDQGSITFAAPASGNQYTYLVFVKPSNAVTINSPTQNAAAYGTPTTNMANTTPAYQHDANAILVYRGNTIPASIDLTGLANNNSWNTFHVAIFNVDGTSYSDPLTFSGSRATSTTITNITTFTSSPANQSLLLAFDFTSTCADEILIVGRAVSAVTVTPSGNGSAYTANATWGSGTDLDGSAVDQFAVYKGTGTSATIMGLTNGVTYHFQAFIRKGSVWRSSLTLNDVPSAAPAIVSLTPPDDGILGSLTLTNAVITFDVAVAKISGGAANNTRTARLYQVGNASPIATVDKDNFTGYGTTTITIPFNAALVSDAQYYIQVGNNAIEKSPNSTDWGGISDNTTWNFTTQATVVTAAPTLQLCYDGNFQTLGDIIISESSVSDFSIGAGQTYSIILPAGFIFNPSAPSDNLIVAGSNISNPDPSNPFTYLNGNTVLRFTYDISGTSGSLDQITLTGLQIKYTGPSTTAISGNIVRIGGSAVQSGNSDANAKNHGTLSFVLANTGLDIRVAALAGDPTIPENQSSFNVNSKAVKLLGYLDNVPTTGGIFSGNSVIFSSSTGGYIFDIPTVGVGSYQITYSVRQGTGQNCLISKTEDFGITSSWINGLLSFYCTSSPTSNITVSQATVDQQFALKYGAAAGTYEFHEFVFWDPSTQAFTTTPEPNLIFNPSSSAYTSSINTYGGIWIGYRARNAATDVVLPDGPNDYFNINYLYLRITPAPVLSFNLPSSICVNASPLDLDALVTPIPSNSVTDNFSGEAASSPGTNQWIFSANNVSNVNALKNVEITYNYTNPNTNCSNTIKRTISVYPLPPTLTNSDISPSTTISVCQNGTPGSFNAPAAIGTSYNWYLNNPPTDYISSGNGFSPRTPYVNTANAGNTIFSVTKVQNGCESAALPITLTVNATPTAPGSSFDKQYCLNASIPNSDFTVSGSNLKWTNATTSETLVINNPNSPTIAELGIVNSVSNKYAFIVSQSISGCEGPPISVTATVHDLPKVFISSTADLLNICKSGNPINLTGTPANGSWGGSADFALSGTNPNTGTTQLNTTALNTDPGSYLLSYSYLDANNCSNSTTVSLQVLPTIIPNISFGTACNGLPVDFTNNSQLIPSNGSTIINSTSWNFGDGSGLPSGTGIIEEGTNAGRTTGDYFSPSHVYSGIGTFQYSATMVTSDGCTINVPLSPITVAPVPDANFIWTNVCHDPVNGSLTQFNAVVSNGIPIQQYQWTFSLDNNLTIANSTSGPSPTVNYSSTGKDRVKLIIISDANCIDEIEKPVYIVPSYPSISEINSYDERFDSNNGNWIDGGVSSSWKHGKPLGEPSNPIIATDASADGNGNAWVTNLTGYSNAGERSWVLSPCFDFTNAEKPVIALDIFSDTPRGLDGAVLQYNENGNIEDDANWVVVGNITSGINWYDQQGIASKPGSQSSGDIGWTGDASGGKYTGWKRAIFKLDNLKGKQNVVFRIAFASGQGRSEGFAFDNVFIGERSRTVLVESFTNTSAAANSANHNNYFKNFSNNSNEVVKIQYHSSFPGQDPLYNANKPLNDSRVAYYGITSSPTMRIDGKLGSGALQNWTSSLYDNQVLQPAPLRIDVAPITKQDGSVKINATITNISSTTLDLTTAHFYAVLVEKSITDPIWLGANGNNELVYVAKEILPSPAGYKMGTILNAGASFTIPELTWSNLNLLNSDNGAIALFVQASQDNREIHQAKLIDATIVPDLVTNTETDFSSAVSVYPNPANKSLTITLPTAANQNLQLLLIDSFGRAAKSGIIQKSLNTKTINTEDMAAGMYILQLETSKGVVRKKVIVAH